MNFIVGTFIFVDISLYFICAVLQIVAKEYQSFNLILFLVAVIISAGLAFFHRSQILLSIRRKTFKEVLSQSITIMLVMGILGMVNYLLYKNRISFDVTKNKIHSLSDQSVKVLNLFENSDIDFTLFAKRSDWAKYSELLRLYTRYLPTIKLQMVDVDSNPALVRINDITDNGTLLVTFKGKKHRAVATDELSVTNVLFKALNRKRHTIGYTSTHSEMKMFGKGPVGLAYLSEKITQSNYNLKELDLMTPVPGHISTILIMNPMTAFHKRELSNLKNFLRKNGKLIVTLSPQFSEILLSKFYNLLASNGIVFQNGMILDRLSSQFGAEASIPVVTKYVGTHPIINDFVGRTMFPLSGILTTKKTAKLKLSSVISSTAFPATWGETDFKELAAGKVTYSEGQDLKGPISIFVTSEKIDSSQRLAVFSSSAFLANQMKGQSPNFNLFLNTLAWTVGDQSLISLNRPEMTGDIVYISDMQVTLISYFAVLCFPFIFFGLGLVIFRRSKSK